MDKFFARENEKFASVKKLFVICVSEILGTAILLFISCLGSYNNDAKNYLPIQGYLASGFAVMIVMHLFANISGAHVNPMTTVCAIILGQIPLILAPIYFVGQIIGSLIGYKLVLVVVPHNLNNKLGLTIPSSNIQIEQALIIEMLIALVLCFANCASWDEKNAHNRDSVAIRFGLLITTMCIIAGPLTGASMNPVRSFGPAYWCNHWDDHWIYWIGPISSGLIGSLIYRIVFFTCNKNR